MNPPAESVLQDSPDSVARQFIRATPASTFYASDTIEMPRGDEACIPHAKAGRGQAARSGLPKEQGAPVGSALSREVTRG